MSFLRLVIIIIGIYLAYRFLFNFLIPIYRTSRKMQQQFREMQEKMNHNMNSQTDPYTANRVNKTESENEKKVNKEDYIDFEEIK